MTSRVNSGQEKKMERFLDQRSELGTQAAGGTALRDQKKCCWSANATGVGV